MIHSSNEMLVSAYILAYTIVMLLNTDFEGNTDFVGEKYLHDLVAIIKYLVHSSMLTLTQWLSQKQVHYFEDFGIW